MRIYIQTTPNIGIVPFNYQHKLVGVLHKWLGTNELHGNISLYSFSWLMNARTSPSGLDYPQGAKFFISFHEHQYVKQVVRTILDDPEMCYGMSVTEVVIEEQPDMEQRKVFLAASPIFIQRHQEASNNVPNKEELHILQRLNYKHYTYNDAEAGELLKETLLHKMAQAGLEPDDTLSIRFDTSYANKKIKLISYRNIQNRVNHCPVIIEGKPETKAFAWDVGLGNSTGIGFGAIY